MKIADLQAHNTSHCNTWARRPAIFIQNVFFFTIIKKKKFKYDFILILFCTFSWVFLHCVVFLSKNCHFVSSSVWDRVQIFIRLFHCMVSSYCMIWVIHALFSLTYTLYYNGVAVKKSSSTSKKTRHIEADGKWLIYSTFTQSALHSHTDGRGNHASHQPAQEGKWGLSVLLKDTSTVTLREPGIELRTLRFPSGPALLLSLLSPPRAGALLACRSAPLTRGIYPLGCPIGSMNSGHIGKK